MSARRTVDIEGERARLLERLGAHRARVGGAWTNGIGTVKLTEQLGELRVTQRTIKRRLGALRRLEAERAKTDKKRAASAAVREAIAS